MIWQLSGVGLSDGIQTVIASFFIHMSVNFMSISKYLLYDHPPFIGGEMGSKLDMCPFFPVRCVSCPWLLDSPMLYTMAQAPQQDILSILALAKSDMKGLLFKNMIVQSEDLRHSSHETITQASSHYFPCHLFCLLVSIALSVS